MKELLHNSIQGPDGTILVSRSVHDYQQHTQEDGRLYTLFGGNASTCAGGSDQEFKDLSIYTTDSHLAALVDYTLGNRFNPVFVAEIKYRKENKLL